MPLYSHASELDKENVDPIGPTTLTAGFQFAALKSPPSSPCGVSPKRKQLTSPMKKDSQMSKDPFGSVSRCSVTKDLLLQFEKMSITSAEPLPEPQSFQPPVIDTTSILDQQADLYSKIRFFIGKDGVYDSRSSVDVAYDKSSGFIRIYVNNCPCFLEKFDDEPGKLILKTLKTAENERHEQYRESITKDVDPYSSDIKPYTRDFFFYVMQLDNSDSRQVRFEVAKYKRRSMYAKYRLFSEEKSKRKKWTMTTSILNSIMLADTVEAEALNIRKNLRKDSLDNIIVQDCTSLVVLLDDGQIIEIERSQEQGKLRCINLPRDIAKVQRDRARNKPHELFAVVGKDLSNGQISVGRLDRENKHARKEWNDKFMGFLAAEIKRTLQAAAREAPGAAPNKGASKGPYHSKFDIRALYRHLLEYSQRHDDLRAEVRRFVRTSILKKYERFVQQANKTKKPLKQRLMVLEQWLVDLMDLENDEENEERMEGQLVLSSFLFDRLQCSYHC